MKHLRQQLRGVKGILRAPSPNPPREVLVHTEYSFKENFAASPKRTSGAFNKIET